jgi:hypothetical protein
MKSWPKYPGVEQIKVKDINQDILPAVMGTQQHFTHEKTNHHE